ncbi:urease accessory protein UreG [Cladochytrium replicatum]|nr:urease accessory protein UreG [Cladochytrium replicatum]
MLALCRALHQTYNIAALTNIIFTKEDAEFLISNRTYPCDRNGPHAAIRENILANLFVLAKTD